MFVSKFKKTLLLLISISATACPFGTDSENSESSLGLLLALAGSPPAENSGSSPETVSTPTFSPAPGNYGASQWISITSVTPDATVLYSDNGTEPACPSTGTQYSGLFKVSSTTTLKAIACKDGMTSSTIQTGIYTIAGTVGTPTFSLTSGTYTSDLSVTLSLSTPDSTIRYTTNGSDPDCATGSEYSAPITLTVPGTRTIKAIGCRIGWSPSSVVSATYEQPSTNPQVISVSPSAGNFIKTDQSIVIQFSESMQTPTATGSIIGIDPAVILSRSKVNADTVTLIPPSMWTTGMNKQLELEVYDAEGNGPYTFSFTYSVSTGNVYYVKKTGWDSNDGLSPSAAKSRIFSAIMAASEGDIVLVAEGIYNVNSSSLTADGPVVLKKGVSVYGGFSNDFSSRDILAYETRIVDGCTSSYSCTAPILSNSITQDTILDGFSIHGASVSGGKAISDSSSTQLTISNCRITAGNLATVAVDLYNSRAVLTANSISGSPAGATNSTALMIWGTSANPVIRSNLIHGGSATGISSGISMGSGTKATIQNNTISGGNGSTAAIALTPDGSSIIENNILFTDNGASGYCIMYTGGSALPSSLKNNAFYSCATYLSQGINSFTAMCAGKPGKSDCSVTFDAAVAADNVAANPNFINMAGKDWRLSASTPCSISAGGKDLFSAIPVDYSGIARTIPFSIGAYEQNNSCP